MERRSVIWRGLHLPRSSWVGLDEVPGLRGERDDDENEGAHTLAQMSFPSSSRSLFKLSARTAALNRPELEPRTSF